MKEYTRLFMACDEILSLYNTQNSIRLEESFIHDNISVAARNFTRSAIAHLVEEKCLKHDSNSGNWYLLLGDGSQLYETGGYKESFKRFNLSEEIKNQLDKATLSVSKSVERTNNAMVKNIQRNNTILVLTLVVAAVSAFGTVGSFIVAYQSKKLNTLPQLQNSQQPQENKPKTSIKNAPVPKTYLKDSSKISKSGL